MANMKQAFVRIGTDIKTLNQKVNDAEVKIGDLTTLEGSPSSLVDAIKSLPKAGGSAADSYATEKTGAAAAIEAVKDTAQATETNALVILATALKTLKDAGYVAHSDVESLVSGEVDTKVAKAIKDWVADAPEALDTIKELAAEIQKNSGGLTGVLTTIGTLGNLKTEAKSSVVDSVNELYDFMKSNVEEPADYLSVYETARGELN